MVAKVISGKDIQGALNYNEQKVQEGVATCIMANLFKKDVEELSFFDKLNRFTSLHDRNTRTQTNTLHISLNFDPTEKLKVDQLNAIAATYMDRIGFGDQPYLVYEHKDTAHQHVHIVTTLIRKDGKRIPIHYLGKNESEKARKEIEKEFNLVVAEKQSKLLDISLKPVEIEKVVYGKSITKKSVSRVVSAITRNYKYTSLPELNAVLRLYNVTADRGSEKSKMFAKGGLLYSIIDQKGNRIGIPVKASAIPGKPTLKFLEKQFKLNELLRAPHKEKLKTAIDLVLGYSSVTTKALQARLQQKNIQVTYRTNAEGRTFGITFIDHNNKTVFNGSDLGKTYSANAVMDKLSVNEKTVKPFRPGVTPIGIPEVSTTQSESLLHQLMQSDDDVSTNPEAVLRLGRRKKKRKGPRF